MERGRPLSSLQLLASLKGWAVCVLIYNHILYILYSYISYHHIFIILIRLELEDIRDRCICIRKSLHTQRSEALLMFVCTGCPALCDTFFFNVFLIRTQKLVCTRPPTWGVVMKREEPPQAIIHPK